MSTMDLLMSGSIFCRACLATGDKLQCSKVDAKKRYFEEFGIEYLNHPQCKWLCMKCDSRINMILKFQNQVTNTTSLLKKTIAQLDSEQNISNSNDFLVTVTEEISIPWNLKAETVDSDSDGDDFDGDYFVGDDFDGDDFYTGRNDPSLYCIQQESEQENEHNMQEDSYLDNSRNDSTFIQHESEAKNKQNICKDNKRIEESEKEKKFNIKKQVLKNEKYTIIVLTREEQLEELKEKSKNYKYQNSPYKCEYCVKGFEFESAYKDHMFLHEPNAGYHKCELCQMYLASRPKYTIHVSGHTKRFKCTKCDYTRHTFRAVSEHYGAEHEADKSRMECLVCGKLFFKKSVMRQHMDVKHGQDKERKECDHCGFIFWSMETLQQHMLIHTNQDLSKKKKRFPCNVCHKEYFSSGLLRHHQRSHDNSNQPHDKPKELSRRKLIDDDRRFYCELCNKSFKNVNTYRTHMKFASNHYDEDKKISCPHCDKRLVDKHKLFCHIEKDHLGIANHKCHLCPRAFYFRFLLKEHIKRIHEKYQYPKKLMCDYCGKTFRKRKDMKCHINTHTGEKPFACRECDARFANSGGLSVHTKHVHRKIKYVKRKRSAQLAT